MKFGLQRPADLPGDHILGLRPLALRRLLRGGHAHSVLLCRLPRGRLLPLLLLRFLLPRLAVVRLPLLPLLLLPLFILALTLFFLITRILLSSCLAIRAIDLSRV